MLALTALLKVNWGNFIFTLNDRSGLSAQDYLRQSSSPWLAAVGTMPNATNGF